MGEEKKKDESHLVLSATFGFPPPRRETVPANLKINKSTSVKKKYLNKYLVLEFVTYGCH